MVCIADTSIIGFLIYGLINDCKVYIVLSGFIWTWPHVKGSLIKVSFSWFYQYILDYKQYDYFWSMQWLSCKHVLLEGFIFELIFMIHWPILFFVVLSVNHIFRASIGLCKVNRSLWKVASDLDFSFMVHCFYFFIFGLVYWVIEAVIVIIDTRITV